MKSVQKMVKKIAIFFPFIFFLLNFHSSILAHKFYFAFAEVEYVERDSKLEATLTVISHDFEDYLKSKNIIRESIEKAFSDSLETAKIVNELNQHFAFQYYAEDDIKIEQAKSNFKIDGYHILLNGNLELYLSSSIYLPSPFLLVKFDLLMDSYPEQQNKLTVIYKQNKKTSSFIINKETQLIDLSNK